MRMLTSTAATLAITLSVVGSTMPASAAMRAAASTFGGDTTFDLGINVGGVALNAKAVAAFLKSKAPETRAAIMGGCETYVKHPEDVRSIRTLNFCELAVL